MALPDRRVGQTRAIYESANDQKLLRQINEFSLSYEKRMFKGVLFAFGLIIYSAICLFLFILNLNVIWFFIAGSLIIFIQLLQCGFEFFEEGVRTQRAYHAYLSGFSFEALSHLRRTARLSAWSQHEIDKHLESIS